MEEITNKVTPHFWRRAAGFRYRWAGIEVSLVFCDFVQGAHIQEAASLEAHVPALGLFAPTRQSSKGFGRTRPYMVGIRDPKTHLRRWVHG